jgi:Arc/MetJ-type ribon-helix-helix transcriptional regulator
MCAAVRSDSPRGAARCATACFLVVALLAPHLSQAQRAPSAPAVPSPADATEPPAREVEDDEQSEEPDAEAEPEDDVDVEEEVEDEDGRTAEQEQDPAAREEEDRAAALALFEQGVDLIDKRQWHEAASCFRRVLDFRWSAAASFNLATVLVELGRYVDASDRLRAVIRDPQADPEMHASAERKLGEITPRIGKLRVRLGPILQGAERLDIVLDGTVVPAPALKAAVAVDPGHHVLFARRDGAVVAREEVLLDPQGSRDIEVVLKEDPELIAAARAAKPAPRVQVVPIVQAPAANLQVQPREPITTKHRRADDDALLDEWWFWVGAGVLATVGITLGLRLAAGDSSGGDPVPGDFDPPVLSGRLEVP